MSGLLVNLGTLRSSAVWTRNDRENLAMPGMSENDIRTRAYELWRAAGEPAGPMDIFWYEAEKQLLAEGDAQGEVPPGMTDNLPV